MKKLGAFSASRELTLSKDGEAGTGGKGKG